MATTSHRTPFTETPRTRVPRSSGEIILSSTFDDTTMSVDVPKQRIPCHFVKRVKDAKAAVSELLASAELAVAIEVVPSVAFPGVAATNPILQRVSIVAIYSAHLAKAFVFKMGTIQISTLAPLWALPIVCHEGVGVLRHVTPLRAQPNEIDSTSLLLNAITNDQPALGEALAQFAGVRIEAVPEMEGVAVATQSVAAGTLHAPLLAEANARNCHGLYQRMRAAQAAFAAMELNGLRFDDEALDRVLASLEEQKARLQARMPDGLDPMDNSAVRAWISASVSPERLASWKHSRGEISLSKIALAAATDVPGILELKEFRQLNETVVQAEAVRREIDSASGRVYSRYHIGETPSGFARATPYVGAFRYAPALSGVCRTADGHTLVVARVPHFRFWIMAALTGDQVMTRALAESGDIYSATVALVNGISASDVTEAQHQAAVAAMGVLFGRGIVAASNEIERGSGSALPRKRVERMRDAVLACYPVAAAWRSRTIKLAKSPGKVVSPCGRVRRFGAGFSEHGSGTTIGHPIQGAHAEIVLDALAAIHAALKTGPAQLVHCEYGEIVVEAPENQEVVGAVAELMERAISGAFQRLFPNTRIACPVDVWQVVNWSEVEKEAEQPVA